VAGTTKTDAGRIGPSPYSGDRRPAPFTTYAHWHCDAPEETEGAIDDCQTSDKAKGIEIEWEGEVDYLKNDLPDLIAAIVAALGITGWGRRRGKRGRGSNKS
jgi:hypothetical protein